MTKTKFIMIIVLLNYIYSDNLSFISNIVYIFKCSIIYEEHFNNIITKPKCKLKIY